MGFFTRVGNLWRGFLSLWIADIEKGHPEIAYENAINSMVGKYAKLKSATAAIIRRREELDERYARATKELQQTEAELNTAVGVRQQQRVEPFRNTVDDAASGSLDPVLTQGTCFA